MKQDKSHSWNFNHGITINYKRHHVLYFVKSPICNRQLNFCLKWTIGYREYNITSSKVKNQIEHFYRIYILSFSINKSGIACGNVCCILDCTFNFNREQLDYWIFYHQNCSHTNFLQSQVWKILDFTSWIYYIFSSKPWLYLHPDTSEYL